MKILKAERADLENILQLQYLAFKSEAELLDNYYIQPLTQTLQQVEEEFAEGLFYKAVDDSGNIIGSVRGKKYEDYLYIGKLMVHPNFQGKGVGLALLKHIESEFKELPYQLYTVKKSIKNVNFYMHHGYKKIKEIKEEDGVTLILFSKNKAV